MRGFTGFKGKGKMIMKEKVQLTKLAPNCGCAAKVGPGTGGSSWRAAKVL